MRQEEELPPTQVGAELTVDSAQDGLQALFPAQAGGQTDFLVRSESAQPALRASLDTPRPAWPWFHVIGIGLVT